MRSNTLPKKTLSLILAAVMLLGLIPATGPKVSAAMVGQNRYGHNVTYTPFTSLTTTKDGGSASSYSRFKLFDATASQFPGSSAINLKDKTAVKSWLSSNSYLLNSYGLLNTTKTSSHWQRSHGSSGSTFSSGTVNAVSGEHQYNVYYDFPGLKSSAAGGNITNMLKKGDIEYLLSAGIKSIQTSWGLFAKSNDWSDLWFMGKHWHEKGGGWTEVNWTGSGGLNYNFPSSWIKAGSDMTLHYKAESDRDRDIDAYMNMGMLIGRDIAGPRISSVTVTKDAAGNEPINGAINLDIISQLNNRTVYFQVKWDEPVQFSGLSNSAIAGLELEVQTVGINGTSGMTAAAPFLSFAPSARDDMPVMTFEYQIPDPYTDSSGVIQERGFYYTLSKIVVSENNNKSLFDHIRDLSGNKFSANRNGDQAYYKLEYTVSGAPYVDLIPFAVENIRVNRSYTRTVTESTGQVRESPFIAQGELVSVTLELNKNFAWSTLTNPDGSGYFSDGSCFENLPTVTLNVKDPAGQDVVLTPTNPADPATQLYRKEPVNGVWQVTSYSGQFYASRFDPSRKIYPLSPVSILPTRQHRVMGYNTNPDYDFYYDVNAVTYNIQLHPGYTVEGDSIKVKSVSSPAGALDASGYRLLDYTLNGSSLEPTNLPAAAESKHSQYLKAPDKRYILDYVEPEVSVTLSQVGDPKDGIFLAHAIVVDPNLMGSDVSFSFGIYGAVDGTVAHQSSTSDKYDGSWIDDDQRSFGAPLVGGGAIRNAYGFIKLPQDVEVRTIHVYAYASDEAGNRGSAQATLSAEESWAGIDGIAPKVSLIRTQGNSFDSGEEYAIVRISDGSKVSWGYVWQDTNGSDGTRNPPPSSIPFGEAELRPYSHVYFEKDAGDVSQVHYKTLWVQARDTAGNLCEPVSMDFVFDRTFVTIDITRADVEQAYTGDSYPSVDVTFEKTTEFWYAWVERPANYAYEDSLNAYADYGDLATYYERWSHALGYITYSAVNEKLTGEQAVSYSTKIQLTESTPVLAVNEFTKEVNRWRSPDYPVAAKDTTRPVTLLIWARDDDKTVYKSFDFDTFYAAPTGIEVRMDRFSSNNYSGQRVDNIRGTDEDYSSSQRGLYWPTDLFSGTGYVFGNETNYRELRDFAEAEFYLAADPATGIDRIDLEASEIILERVLHGDGDGDKWNNPTTYERFPVESWSLADMIITGVGDISKIPSGSGYINTDYYDMGDAFCDYYRMTLTFDPGLVDASPYAQSEAAGNGESINKFQRYEFVLKLAYKNGQTDDPLALGSFVFDNDAAMRPGIHAMTYGEGNYPLRFPRTNASDDTDQPPAPVEAVIDSEGRDITSNTPLLLLRGNRTETTLVPEIRFSASEWRMSHRIAYAAQRYGSMGQSGGQIPFGLDLNVRYGTSPDNLSGTAAFKSPREWPYETGPLADDGLTELITLPALVGESAEYNLYYQFYDTIHGSQSPVYVVKLRRDITGPRVHLSVSETQEAQQEVAVRVESIVDIHEVSLDGGATLYVTDTPAEKIDKIVLAYQAVLPGESLPEEFEEGDVWPVGDTFYLRFYPDEDGVYLFTRNGFILAECMDENRNANTSLYVNGELYEFIDAGQAAPIYFVNNIDRTPPAFTGEPVWTENADGSFTVSATVDDPETQVYLRFDGAYSALLTGTEEEESPLFSLESLPGLYTGGFDAETGEIRLTVYVKPGEGAALTAATLVVADLAGNIAESGYEFEDGGLAGVAPAITNTKNANGYPIYTYGGSLEFTAPVVLSEYKTGYHTAHGSLPVYQNGLLTIAYTDLFGTGYGESVYADIVGPAFAHSLTFSAGGQVINPLTPTNLDVTVSVDTGGTPGLTVNGQTLWQTTLTENGTVSYTLTSSAVGQPQIMTLPVTNIDKTPPVPYVSAQLDSGERTTAEGETETLIFSVTYRIDGFDEDNVAVVDDQGNPAPASITFDGASAARTHTFRFVDPAGNRGEYKVDATGIAFANPSDTKIASYRMTWESTSPSGVRSLGAFTAGETVELGQTNGDVTVRLEGLNAAGEVVPSVFSTEALPKGATAFSASRSILFAGESAGDRTVSVTLTGLGSGNAMSFDVTLPGGTIDQTPPSGTVVYEPAGNNVKARLIIRSDDVAPGGVSVTGQKSDGTPLELKQDDLGWYVEFDENGSGYFVLADRAGNLGSVAIIIQTIDNAPPALGAEGWSGVFEVSSRTNGWKDTLDLLLNTPTNNSIKIFFSFNEQLSRVEVDAFAAPSQGESNPTPLPNSSDYVTAIVSGSTVTLEFLQNCQARIVVYDLRGNATVLWRPEDGPVRVIDKQAPELDGIPASSLADNKVTVTYAFKNGEEVMLLSQPAEGYLNVHSVEFAENGQHLLTFADPAGNVLTVPQTITGIDDEGPHVKMSMELADEGNTKGGKDADGNAYFYTGGDVHILLSVEDKTAEGLTVTAKKLGGAEVAVQQGAFKATVGQTEKTYNYRFTVKDNGVYEITATDKWGQANVVNATVTLIDKTPPVIKLASTKPVSVSRNADIKTVEAAVLQGVTATDAASGIMGGGDITLTVDLDGVDRSKAGSYNATITATDPLGNEASKLRTVIVRDGDVRVLLLNGSAVETNDVYSTTAGTVTVSADDPSFGGEKVTLYYARGYLTAAQMKYATPFNGAEGFAATEKGYYTVLAQGAERGMYLVYVYVS